MIINNDWKSILKEEFTKDYFKILIHFIESEYNIKSVLPSKEDIFASLNLTSYKDVSVVILGQNPYPTKNVPMGLAFSTNRSMPIPKSLKNIYKELNSDLGCSIPTHGDLSYWAKQGVLLLNSSLTVIEGLSTSHIGIGWEIFTDKIISLINEKEKPVVFILWGNNAK